jgi:hypothetical protein
MIQEESEILHFTKNHSLHFKNASFIYHMILYNKIVVIVHQSFRIIVAPS